jgi:hypothetical protein
VYTLEASFCGSSGYHYTSKDYERIGYDFLLSIAKYGELLKGVKVPYAFKETIKDFQ